MTAPVAAALLSFIEVPAGAHRAYNEFHQLDHLPEQFRIPGVVFGQRWVTTPALRAARPVTSDDALGRAQYLAVYLLSEPVADALEGMRTLALELRDAGRFFERRETTTFGGWRLCGAIASAGAVVSPEVLPWRPTTGVHLVVQPTAASPVDSAAVAACDGVAGCWTFEPDPAASAQLERGEASAHRFTLVWLDGDPGEAGRAIGAIPADGAVLSATYEAIVPGRWDWFD